MTKEKLIKLITTKQTYKQLKSTLTQVSQSNIQSIRNSISAIQEILTKQYNAQSKLYALRFLKDCFEMGSLTFIKSTQENILPIITNIVIQSTDQTAITKYAGSSFTKTTDLEKFKSIIVSFFRLAKQSLMKWASWVSNPQFKFKAAFESLQKKGIKFENQFKYFRVQNQLNFQKNCKQNGFPIIINTSISNFTTGIKQKSVVQKIEVPLKPVTIVSKIPQPKVAKQKIISQSSVDQLKLGKRQGPKGNNKFILKCHKIFKEYDQKLKNGTMVQNDLQQMNNKVNSQLDQYMGLPDLNQSQWESQLTPIFQNIKNVKEDFNKMKQRKIKTTLSIQSSQSKAKNLNLKKTQQLNSNKKIQTPQSPINQLNTPNGRSPKGNNVKFFDDQPVIMDLQEQLKKQRMQGASSKKVEPSIKKQIKHEKKKIEVFQDDGSIIQSEIKTNQKVKTNKQVKIQKPNISQTSSKRRFNTNQNKKNEQKSNNAKYSIKSESDHENVSIQKSLTKDKRSGAKQRFDSNLDISHEQSSRVNFSESQIDEDSYDQGSKLTGNFKKQKTDLKLSSIAQQQQQRIQNSSRRNFSELQQQSSLRKSVQIQKQKQKVVQVSSILPSKVKTSQNAIDDYEKKIKALQQHLKDKQSKQKQLQKRLTELNVLKRIQQEELQKIREQNNKILERFSNAVDPQQYARTKKDFEQMKQRNRKMERNMDKLMRQIQGLKIVQKQHTNQNIYSLKSGNKQNDLNQKSKGPIKMFQSSQNILKPSSIKKSIELQKPKYIYKPIDPDYAKNRTHLSKINQFLDQNNLTLLKKNMIGANELFYNSEQMSFICRTSPFKNEKVALKLQLTFQFNGLKKKQIKPIITIPNFEQIEVWKKNVTGQQYLYHQQIVVKLKHFPFNLMKIQVQTSQHLKKSVLLPFIYFSFLKKSEFKQQEFNSFFEQNKDNAIKSKVFNLNFKILKDFKSLHFYQGYSLPSQNRICFKLYEESQKLYVFWCQLINLSKQKCILKIIPQPYNQEMYVKSQQLMQNLIFLIGV